jgi:hypothetical protein
VPSATGPKKKIPDTKEKKTLVGLVVCFSQQHFPTISSSSTATILCSRKTQTLVKGRNQLKTELALGNNRATKTIEKNRSKKKKKPNQTKPQRGTKKPERLGERERESQRASYQVLKEKESNDEEENEKDLKLGVAQHTGHPISCPGHQRCRRPTLLSTHLSPPTFPLNHESPNSTFSYF